MSLELVLLCAALGVIAGLLAGLLGVGGGVVVVPALVMLLPLVNVPEPLVMHLAVGTSLATIIFTGASSALKHHRQGNVEIPIALRLGGGVLVGSLLGGFVVGFVPATVLRVVFLVFIMLVALRMLFGIQPPATWQLPSPVRLFGAGGTIGALSAWVGIGGGALTVPFLVACHVDVRKAIGTSAALGSPLALAGVTGFILSGWRVEGLPPHSLGYVYLPALLGIAPLSMIGAPIGAAWTNRVPAAALKRGFAVLLLGASLKMALDLFP